MRLLQFQYSPYAAKVRAVLALKRLPCEVVNVPYTARGELVALTGELSIPVLHDGDAVVSDSPRIVAYLERKGGPPLCADPLGSLIEQWADELFEETAFRLACPGLEEAMGRDQGLEARAWFRLVKERKYGAGAIARWKAEQGEWLAKTKAMLAPVEAVLKTKPYLLGDGPSIADCAVMGQLFMLEVALPGFVQEHAPALTRWYQALRA